MTKGFRGVVAALAFAFAGPVAAEVDADIGDELVIEFDQAMQTWTDARPAAIRTHPALPMRCRWDEDTRLACAFDDGVEPRRATRYSVHLPAMTTQDGERLPARTLGVETARPSLSASPWTIDWRGRRPVLRVDASPDVDARAAKAALVVEVDGRAVAFDLLAMPPRHPGAWPAFEIRLPDGLPADARLQLRVRPGLASTAGPLPGTQDEVLLRARINEPSRLERVDCTLDPRVEKPAVEGATAVGCEPGDVHLAFSTRLADDARARISRALPAGLRLLDIHERSRGRSYDRMGEARSPGSVVRLALDAPRTRLRIDLPAGLADAEGHAVAVHPVVVATGDHPPALEAPHAELLLADARTATLATAVNALRGVALSGWSLGRTPASGTITVPQGPLNTPVPIDDARTRSALAAGAWSRWSIEQPGRGGARLHLAAPQLDVFTVTGTDEVLAWVHDWAGGAVEGAGVELLLAADGNGAEAFAHALTGRDGVARLRLPEERVTDAAARGQAWFVRAESRGRRAVLRLGEGGYGLDLGQPARARAWGVTDRPLYRAGDTVRFRLWSRGERGGALRPHPAAATTLHLHSSDEGKSIRSWRAQPDGEGWTGEVAIPEHAVDGTYCVVPDALMQAHDAGACFFVGTYRAQDLWAEAKAQAPLLRPGERFVFDVSGGYYSGGPAAAVALQRVSSMLTGLPLSQAYPQYAGFTFVDVMTDAGRDGVALRLPALPARTDADGRVRIELPLDFQTRGDAVELPAFGELKATADLGLDSREATTSSAATTRFARFDAYVGLRLAPRWLDAKTPVRAEAVLIDAQGRALPPRDVEVDIEFRPGYRDDAPAERVGTCRLRPGAAMPCDFPRLRSGRYRLVARSGDAAPAQLDQYVWAGDAQGTQAPEPVLEADGPTVRAGAPARVVLRNAVPGWPVLFVVHRGRRILGHLQAGVATAAAAYEIPLPADAQGALGITAYLRDPAGGTVDGVLRRPARVLSANTQVDVERPARAPLTLAFDRAQAAPGTTVVLTLRNDDARPREVSLAVMDDALRALAGDWLAFSDPHGRTWLGGLADDYRYGSPLAVRSFEGWNRAPWRLALARPVPEIAPPPPPGEPPVVVGDPSPVDAPAPAPPPAPPAPAAVGNIESGGSDLDRVEVTGSRIRAVAVWGEGAGRAEGAALALGREADGGRGPAGARPSRIEGDAAGLIARLARVRGAFADSAHWTGRMTLAAGETRRIELRLPDNLTRWRAVAWSVGGAEDFETAEAAIEAGLPVEARLQGPVRVYPGDRTRLVGTVRQTGDAPGRAEVALLAAGAGLREETATTLELAARGQAPFTLALAPQATGVIDTTAAVRMPQGGDGVGGRVEVASPLVEGRRVQAGFVDGDGVALDVPALPAGSHEPHLHVELLRGATGVVERWTRDLRDYRHRCWEQILSRAIGAALALERGDAQWPDARAAVAEALDNAAVFQDEDGGFHFFADSTATTRSGEPRREVALTAWSLQALERLQALGHGVPADVLDDARRFLRAQRIAPAQGDEAIAEAAFAATAVDAPTATRDVLWSRWEGLALPVRVATTRALERTQDPRAAQAWSRLLADAPRRGARRVLRAPAARDGWNAWTRWMASPLREQCTLVDLASRFAPGDTRRELIAGLTDLYAGGVERTDTQSAAVCLLALRDVGLDRSRAVPATLRANGRDIPIAIAAGADRARWDAPAPGLRTLGLTADAAAAAFPGFVAELRYREDARTARPSAVGFDIERRYEVLREGRWQPLAADALRESEWVRITLVVSTSAPRHFVALADAVPGGLQPTDLRLSGVGGLDLQAVSATGSGWFGTRRLDPRAPKFYAQWLPAGRHEVHYFARAAHVGDYLAAPATAELMYGNASHARTAAARIAVDAAP